MASFSEKMALLTDEGLEKAWRNLKELTFESVRQFGKLVSEKHAAKRIEFCNTRKDGQPCEYSGVVHPLSIKRFEAPGCTKCGCPFETKAHMETFVGTRVKCPHPVLGNLWETIDNFYLTEKESN